MDPLRIIVLVLHISAAAFLIGVPTGTVRNLKANLQLGKDAFKQATEDASRRGKLAGMSSLLTLATGLTLIFMAGGFGSVPLNFHMALTLMLVAIVLSAVLIRPTITKLAQLALVEPIDKGAALGLTKRIAMGTGILHLLWLIMLTLMFVRIYK